MQRVDLVSYQLRSSPPAWGCISAALFLNLPPKRVTTPISTPQPKRISKHTRTLSSSDETPVPLRRVSVSAALDSPYFSQSIINLITHRSRPNPWRVPSPAYTAGEPIGQIYVLETLISRTDFLVTRGCYFRTPRSNYDHTTISKTSVQA